MRDSIRSAIDSFACRNTFIYNILCLQGWIKHRARDGPTPSEEINGNPLHLTIRRSRNQRTGLLVSKENTKKRDGMELGLSLTILMRAR
jgi:hypothetical protein